MHMFSRDSLLWVCVLVIALGLTTTTSAAPIVYCKDGPIDLAATGCISGGMGYVSDGDGLYDNSGGGDSEPKVEQSILLATGMMIDIVLYGKSDDNPSLFTFTPTSGGALTGSQSGTWTVNDGTAILYITIKAAQGYALYDVGGAIGGIYTTEGMLNPGGNQPNVSHISFWTSDGNDFEHIPEPGTVALMGLGLLAVGSLKVRRKRA